MTLKLAFFKVTQNLNKTVTVLFKFSLTEFFLQTNESLNSLAIIKLYKIVSNEIDTSMLAKP